MNHHRSTTPGASSLRSLPPRGSRRGQRVRRVFAATAVAATMNGVAAGVATATPTTRSPVPAEVPGDPHSPATAMYATSAMEALRSGRQDEFAQFRTDAATAAAKDLGIDATALVSAFAGADADHQIAVLSALSQLGVQYRSASSEAGVAFDCSGLTRYAWGQAGVELARQSGSQIDQSAPLDASQAQPGDLIYYPGHVSMYLGVDGALVHAANQALDVELAFVPGSRSVTFADPDS